jgi:hypothetical protein
LPPKHPLQEQARQLPGAPCPPEESLWFAAAPDSSRPQQVVPSRAPEHLPWCCWALLVHSNYRERNQPVLPRYSQSGLFSHSMGSLSPRRPQPLQRSAELRLLRQAHRLVKQESLPDCWCY